jgi:hypothetical protein
MALGLTLLGACGPSKQANRGSRVVAPESVVAPAPTRPDPAEPARPADMPPDAGPADAAPEAAPPARTPDAAAPEVMRPPPPPEPTLSHDAAVAPDATVVIPDATVDHANDLAPPPAVPGVEVSFAVAPTNIDLTAAAAIDWVHYGYQNSNAVNRKKSVAPLITMTPIAGASLDHYADRPVRFSWTDGAPVASASNINDGVNVGEAERRGFQLRAEGNPQRARVLELYVGVWAARARMEVRLQRDGGSSRALYSDDSLEAVRPGKDRVYRIRFLPASAAEKLVVTWSLASMAEEYGNVTLQAAVLTE